jgi:uncharacterized protein (TIGR02145 family)
MLLFSLLLATLISISACYIEKIEPGQSSASIYSEASSSSRSSSSSRELAKQEPLSYPGGQSYETVKMNSQIWLAENLNEEPSSGKSWCYGNMEQLCLEYGKLYDWYAAKTICPEGWKLPSKDDFYNLSKDFGDVLNSKAWWNATLGGYKKEDDIQPFLRLDAEGNWWSSSDDGDRAYYYSFLKDGTKLNQFDEKKTKGYSVRCIKHLPR